MSRESKNPYDGVQIDAPLNEVVVIRLHESDGCEDGCWWGLRRDDVKGMEIVRRADTLGEGLWVPFHDYTDGHPRHRKEKVTMWLLLKTGGDCPEE